MRTPMFSILMVSLNPGDKLVETMRSVIRQSYRDYEVVVKDGGSKDGALEALRGYLNEQGCQDRVRILEQPDTGIYEGMNQATQAARGEYFYFLNCGDAFASDQVLAQAAEEIGKCVGGGPGWEACEGPSRKPEREVCEGTSRKPEREAGCGINHTPEQKTGHETNRAWAQGAFNESGRQNYDSRIFYGDIYDALRGQVVASNPHMDDFACYRNVPCHQACIYHHSLFEERGYEPKYRVRADYEHFLWCYFRRDAQPRYIPVTLALYEGGGFSETPENRKRSALEHREITALYMGKGQRLKYKLILLVTLAPLRTKMAESPVWSGFYNKCKKLLYRREN